MTQPGIDPQSLGPLANTQTIMPMGNACKLLVLDRNTWYHNWVQTNYYYWIGIDTFQPYDSKQIICIRLEYLIPFNCVQANDYRQIFKDFLL